MIGPFRGDTPGRASLEVDTPVEAHMSLNWDASATWRPIVHRDHTYCWKPAKAGKRDFVDLGQALGPADWAVAYGYATIESAEDQETTLRCGSDDAVRIWLNGRVVHSHEVGRLRRRQRRGADPPAGGQTCCW